MSIIERKVSQLPDLERFLGSEYILVGFNGKSYKTTLNNLIAHFNEGIDLETIAALREEIDRINNLGELVTVEKLAEALANIGQVDLSAYVTTEAMQSYVAQAIANIEHPAPDLSGLATRVEVQELIDNIQHPPVDLTAYATTESVDQKIAAIQIPPAVDLTEYATNQSVDQKIAAINIPEMPDLSGYMTSADVDQKIAQIDIPAAPDLSGYATNQSVDEKIAAIEVGGGVDLTNYYTKSEVNQLVDSIEIPQIPDLSGYVTGADLDQKLDALEIPEPVDTSSFATNESVDQKIAAIEHPAFPDLSGYMTSADVDQKIAQINIPEMPDLSGLATKEEVATQIAAIEHPSVDLSGYATKEEVSTQIANIQIPEMPDLDPYATKDGVTAALEAAVEAVNEDKLVAADIATGKVMWVSGADHGADANGSLARPYKGIQQAVDAIPAGSEGWVILVTPNKAGDASYREDVVISGKNNLIIQGFGCNGAHTTIMYGQIKITGAATRIRIKDLAIRAPLNKEALVVDGSEGRHYFDNLDITGSAGASAAAVKFTGGFKRWSAFTACAVAGNVIIENAAAGASVYFNGHNSLDTNLYINTDAKVFVKNAILFGYIEQNAGELDVRYAGAFKGLEGKAIKSTVPENRCYVSFCDFEVNGSYLELEGDNIVRRMCNEAA